MAIFQMFPLKTNNILQLFNWKDQINLDPPYQRISVWDRNKQQWFIDSVLNGFDVPKLYFHEVPPSSDQSKQYKYSVIDGKQRLLALWDFMSNKFPLAEDFIFFEDESIQAGKLFYSELMSKNPRLRARFDSFDLPVTIVRTDDDNFIEQLFARLNIQMPLSAPELRNALGGPIPFIIRKIGVTPFFLESVSIPNNRLQHFDLAAKFLYLTYSDDINATKKIILDTFVKIFRSLRDLGDSAASPNNLTILENRTREILDIMYHFYKKQDVLLNSQGKITLYFHAFRLCKKNNQQIPFDRQILAQFDDELIAARKKSYRRATGSNEQLTEKEQLLISFDLEKHSLNDAGAIKRRYDYMNQYFKLAFNVTLPNYQNPTV